MYFLIEYDRSKGRIIRLESFKDSDKHEAENLRLKIELELKRKAVDHEVVILQAENKDALRQPHRRYFEDHRGIGRSINTDAA